MSCGEGYPKVPCPFGFEGRVTRESCGACKHYIPPRHILKWCMLWDRERILCKLPREACEKCREKAPPRGPGKPKNGEARFDLTDPEDRKKYEAEYRIKNADKIAATREAFFDRHPHYMRDYMREYRKKLREGKNEPSEGEVQPDASGLRSERDQDLHAPRPADGDGSGVP